MARDEKPPAFLFYVDDFVSDGVVEAMTTEQVGAYVLLLCKAWREHPVGTIPMDDAVLSRWARLTGQQWNRLKPGVLRAFAEGSDGRWHQKRMKVEYSKWKATLAAKKRGGKKGALKRWHGTPIADPCHTHDSAISSSIAKNGNQTSNQIKDKSKNKNQPPNSLLDQTKGQSIAAVPFDQKEVSQEAWIETFADFDRQLGGANGDRSFVAQLAWLVCAGAPILSHVRDALAGMTARRRDGEEIKEPGGYLRATLKASVGEASLVELVSLAPSYRKCKQVMEVPS